MIVEFTRDKMDNSLLNGMPGLNCLLEKHRQMQERSAIKTQGHPQEGQNNINVTHYHNQSPILQCTNGYYNPNPMLQCANNYFNPNPTFQYANNFYNPNPMLQYTNDYYNLNPMLNGYYNPNSVLQYANSCYNPNPMLNPYYNQNPMNNYYNPNNFLNSNGYQQPTYQVPQEMPFAPTMNSYQIPQEIHSVTTVGSYQAPQETPTVSTGKVYVNPHYNKNKVTHSNTQGKHSVHVNPKLMTKLIPNVPEKDCNLQQNDNIPKVSDIPSTATALFQNGIDISNIDSNAQSDSINSSTPITQDSVIEPRTKFVENNGAFKRNLNSSFVVLSRRKIVRKRSSTSTSSTSPTISEVTSKRRLSSSGLKKVKSPKRKTLSFTSQLYNMNSLQYVRNLNTLNSSIGLVSIDGVFYKKSRNQLVRSDPINASEKGKCNSILDNDIEHCITENNKLLDLSTTKSNSSLVKLNSSISPVKNYKTNVSNKVKQRSLQILRDKMRKNNQTCLLFQKFGYCASLRKGTCPKVHDKKQIAVCRNFLQGKCLLNDCPLSHDVGPEKMPTCKYFLKGCCTREGCPYLHVKVSSKKPICVEFLRGYCPQGNECQNRHIFACPEFDKSNSCSKGKFCPYPHKSPLTETKKPKRPRKSFATAGAKESAKQAEEPKVLSNKRYYDETSEDLSEKRHRLLKQVDIMKDVHTTRSSDETEVVGGPAQTVVNGDAEKPEETVEIVCNRPRRPPIGPLPAYIPIE